MRLCPACQLAQTGMAQIGPLAPRNCAAMTCYLCNDRTLVAQIGRVGTDWHGMAQVCGSKQRSEDEGRSRRFTSSSGASECARRFYIRSVTALEMFASFTPTHPSLAGAPRILITSQCQSVPIRASACQSVPRLTLHFTGIMSLQRDSETLQGTFCKDSVLSLGKAQQPGNDLGRLSTAWGWATGSP